MFDRRMQNKSGVISVQIVDKSTGSYRMLKTIGSNSMASEVERLAGEGKEWIKKRTGSQELDFSDYANHTKIGFKRD